MKWLCVILCFIVGAGVVNAGFGHRSADRIERIKARGKCREIRVRQYDVVVKFTCEEDAKLFAEDLRNFITE